MSPLRAATAGATTASASFSSTIGTPNLPIDVRAPDTINRCNSAGGKTRHAARWPHGRSGSNLESQHFIASLFDALYDADPNSKDVQDILPMFNRLDESCPH
jgi:hypothetical protein